MKKILSAVFAAALLAAFVGCVRVTFTDSGSSGYSDADLTAVTNITAKGEIPADLKTVDVDNHFGTIHLTGIESGPAEWSWKLTVRARDAAAAKEAAEAASCTARREGDLLRLIVSLPDSRGKYGFRSDLEIRAPKSVSVRTQNRFGKTEISALQGEADVTGQSGAVDIRNVGGKVRAQTSFATLTVQNTGPGSLKNQSGRIEATGIRGPLDAETSFGTLAASNVEGLAILRNKSGQIEATEIHGPLDADTSFGDLVARTIDGPVKLRNQSGRVEVAGARGDADIKTSFAGLRAKGISGNATLVNQSGKVEASDIAGAVVASTSFAPLEVNGAGSKFVCHNQSGSIRLHASSTALASIEAKTSFNLLEVRLAASLKPAIQARTSFGDIESDFPVLLKPRGQNPFADVEPGTPRITLENQSGNIRVVRE